MASTKNRVRVIGVALSALSLVLASPGAAHAAQSFDIWTTSGGTLSAGQARTIGSVTFNSKTKFTLNAIVEDFCPADGHGAYVWADAKFMDGSSDGTGIFVQDTNGCDNGGFEATKSFTFAKNVKSVQITLAECDAHDGYIGCWYFTNEAMVHSTWKDNPYTG